MKKIIIALAVSCISMHLSAQQYIESVYLKNGSIIKGTVIEQVPDGDIKIQRNDGSVYVYPMSEVIKITKEQVAAPVPVSTVKTKTSTIQEKPLKQTPEILLEWWEGDEFKRASNSRFGFELGNGFAPSNISSTFRSDPTVAEMEESGDIAIGGSPGYSLQMIPTWTMFLNEGSKWFLEAGLLAEYNRSATSIYAGQVTTKNIVSNWFLGPQVNFGMCLIKHYPTTEGYNENDHTYLYWKAGLSFGWAMGGQGTVKAYMDDELVSTNKVSNGGATKFIVRPNIEVGVTVLGTFSRFGIRYSPAIINNLQYHPVSIVLHFNIPEKKVYKNAKRIPAQQ